MALRRQVRESGAGSQQQGFEAGAGGLLQAAPFLYGDQNGRLDAAPGYNLWAFGDACIEKFAEASLSVLELPRAHIEITIIQTSHMTSQFEGKTSAKTAPGPSL
jgi:hypothetical protein